MPLGRPLRAKLLLEGVEVPFIGATITSSVDQASIAYIDLVPLRDLNNIKPRTTAHIFVRDFMNEEENFPFISAWEGEVFGFSFGRTTSSRTFSISCIDFSSYWDNCLSYYFNAQQSLGSGSLDKASQAMTLADVFVTGEKLINTVVAQASYFKNKIDEVLKDTKKDFLDAFAALYGDIGNVNEFFKNAEGRLRISDRVVLHSSQKLTELLTLSQASDWFTGVTGRTSGYASLRMVIQDLMGIIFHDAVSVAFPAAVTKKMTGTSVWPKKNVKKTIGSFAFKPNLYMIPPPACNIFFPDEYSSFQLSRNFFKEPTRLIYMPEIPARLGGGSASTYLPHVYEPPSFSEYMLKRLPEYSKYKGESATQIPSSETPGSFGDKVTDEDTKKTTAVKREQQFLTSEEYVKGIWLSRESMMPASTQFRQNMDDLGKRKFTSRVAKYLFYKKRFEDRSLQVTSHLKMSLVAGFPVLIMDDSDADQNVIAYCSSLTHRIYATEGGYTNAALSYARYIGEQDASSSFGAELLIPPWFEESIFGKVDVAESEAAPDEVASGGVTIVSTKKLSDFYAAVLGDKGTQALTNMFPKETTVVGSVRKLIKEYRKMREKGTRDLQAYIAKTTARDYIKMEDCLAFIGSTTKAKSVEEAEWLEFTGGAFSRKGQSDAKAIALRKSIITAYRDRLKAQRGFRG